MKKVTFTLALLIYLLLGGIMSLNAQNATHVKDSQSRKEIFMPKIFIMDSGLNGSSTNNQMVDFSLETNNSASIEVVDSSPNQPALFKTKDVLLDEGFEVWPPVDWNFYEMGVASAGWQQSTSQPHTGTYTAYHGYFAGGVHDNWMVTPQLYIDQIYDFKFWDRLTSYNYYEYSGVHISIGSGDPSSGDFVEIYNANSVTNPTAWAEHIFDLTPYIGEYIYIAFQYSGNNAHRWYVDDVSIIPLTYTDGGLTTITNPPVGTTTIGGSIEDVMVVLENFGTEVIEDAEIEWMVNSVGQPIFSSSALSLMPGESVELNIGQYDFSEYTIYDISVTCIITGDQNAANDNKTGIYTVDDLGDAGITGISPKGQSGPAYEQDVKVTIQNYGTQVLESVEIEWEVDGITQTPFIASNLGLTSGSSIQRTIGQFDFSNPDHYTIFAGTNLPIDYVPANDTMSVLFSSAMLWESFEGPQNDFWPPDHWEMKYATYMLDFPYHGNFMGNVLSGGNEWGVSDGWLTTPLLNISPGDFINFQLRTEALSSGGFTINWQDGQTGELHLIQSVSNPNWGEWCEKNIDISSASGINRIVFKVSSTTYADAYLDLITCTAPVYTYDYDLEVLRFEHNWTPYTNTQDTIKGTVRNYTANSVDAGSYTVKLMEEPGIELETLTGLALDPMQSEVYEFQYTFSDEDQHNLYIEVEYSLDQNPDDNVSTIASIYPVPVTTENREIGEAENGNLNIPFDTFGTEGLGQDDFTQIIYQFEDIGSMGYIYGLKFNYYLYALMYGQELPLKVWVGETLNNDLSGGWEPYENLTLVFDSLVITKNYLNEMFIPFDEPYLYTGGNLVVQIIQYDPEFMASWTNFLTTNTPGELRTAKSPDWYELDPENPPSFELETQYWEQLPDATFILNPFENIAEVTGSVLDENSQPIEEAFVELDGTAISTFTNNQGLYSFPTIPYSEWSFKASFLGYEDNIQTITVDEEAEILDFNMIPKPLVLVTGYVEGSEQSGVGLEDVIIEISGYNTYDALSGTDGIFNITDVFGNADYELNVSKFGYESFSTTFTATDENIDFGTIILQERVISTYNVTAQENPDDYIAEIFWPDPLTAMEDTLQLDWGDETYGLANDPNENVWLGNKFINNETITITSVTVYFINNPQTSGEVSLDIFDMSGNLLVSSEKFYTQNASFLDIDFPNLTYDEDLYIMLHWKDNPATTNMLGIDFTPNINNYCYIHYPGQGFELLSDFMGTGPGCALIRANILKEAGDKTVEENKAVQSYNIYRGESDDFYNIGNWTQVNSIPITELEYIDESWLNTEPNDYRYAVEAVYAEGNAEVTYANILSIDFISPTNLLIDVDQVSGETLFSWDSPEHNVQNYSVFLDDLINPVATDVSDLNYIFQDLGPGFYTAGVKAVYNTGDSDIETINFTITGIDDISFDNVNIYPNPANTFVNIINAKGSEVIIFDLSGRQHMYFQCENDKQQINISKLDSGVYTIRILNNGNIVYKKLEIIK